MKTKEEYEKALKEMNDAFYGITFTNSKTRRFDDNLNLLRELVNEHFEEKKETNFEHYKDEIIEVYIEDLAISKGRMTQCCEILCSECGFADENGDCIGHCRIIEWLKKPYQKQTYKLTKFEFDLIKTFDHCKECCLLNEIECLKKLREKGYFNGIDPFTKVNDIIDNCEVIE